MPVPLRFGVVQGDGAFQRAIRPEMLLEGPSGGAMGRYGRFVAFAHYRMPVIELWPEGPAKQAALHSVRSKLSGLLMAGAPGPVAFECMEYRQRLSPPGCTSQSTAGIFSGLAA